ncbi:MAG: hypothetical protein L0Z62_12755 [Gemmataceae bacterium]|nr:hypothetical protein [Gemmataceae bacterium]
MVELSSGKERADQGGTGPSTLPRLRNLLEQARQLHSADVFTSQEHDQLSHIFQAALKRLEQNLARRQPHEREQPAAGGKILDGIDLGGDPYASDVLDARELEEAGIDLGTPARAEDDTILDALDIRGDVNAPDVLEPREVTGAEDEILDAVDLGDADDRDALEANMLEEYDLDPAQKADQDSLYPEDENHDEDAVRFVDDGEAGLEETTVYFERPRDNDPSR